MAIEYLTRSRSTGWKTGRQVLAKSLVEKAEKRLVTNATFLSHSSLDAELLPYAISILEEHGGEVYIDKKDSSLPPYTNRETAKALRSRISKSKKFILLASENSKDSRWVPWELGLADGNKKHSNVAIFPTVESQSDTKWTEREYLGAYDRIVYGDLSSYSSKVWMVLDQERNTATELRRWLANVG
jgi:hypothetical protein